VVAVHRGRYLMQLHVIVRGRVQGVGFRWFVREAARRRNVAGWVRNLPDGGVEIAAEAPEPDIKAFRELLARGPDGAGVETVDDVGQEASDLTRPFAIIR
jgi:acylphosphatase